MENQIGAPTLVDFDWCVDIKTSSSMLSRMQVPTVMVNLKIQSPPKKLGVMSGTRDIHFELSKQALNTMLDGLGKIRDQLDSVK